MTDAAPLARGRRRPPKLAVWKLASCDGCQLSLLDCEDELLTVAGAVRIANFAEASSARLPGPYDLSLVEGSITTAVDADRIQRIRSSSRHLVTIGACATAGGIQGLRDFAGVEEYRRIVYASPEYVETLATSTPVSAHVTVDFELRGCPIDRGQLLEVVAAFLHGRRPVVPTYSVCVDCKAKGNPCVLVAQGAPCLGPVTQTGCGALCPSFGRGCYGCWGPSESAAPAALRGTLTRLGMTERDVLRLYRTFNAGAPAFRDESSAHDTPGKA